MECTSSEPTANICCTSQFLKSTLRARECELEWKALPRSHVGLFAFDPVLHNDDARNSVTTTTKSFLSTPTTFLTHFRPTDIGSRAVFDDRLCNDHLRVFFFFHISSQPPRRSIGTGRRNISAAITLFHWTTFLHFGDGKSQTAFRIAPWLSRADSSPRSFRFTSP